MDIVERLRSRRVDVSEVDIAEAADLIDRLRAEVADQTRRADGWSDAYGTVRDERDRLRELLRSLRSVVMEDYRHLIDAALGGEGK